MIIEILKLLEAINFVQSVFTVFFGRFYCSMLMEFTSILEINKTIHLYFLLIGSLVLWKWVAILT